MKANQNIKRAAATAITALSSISIWAQTPIESNQIETQLTNVTSNIGKIVNPIINIVLAIVGIIAIGVIAWAFAKKKRGEQGANDAIMDTAWTTLAVVAFIYVVKAFFFGM